MSNNSFFFTDKLTLLAMTKWTSDSVGGVKMQVETNHSEPNYRERIWFFPNKFWAATKGMAEAEIDRLMQEVERYAEAKDLEALKKYPFVFVGDPYKDERDAA